MAFCGRAGHRHVYLEFRPPPSALPLELFDWAIDDHPHDWSLQLNPGNFVSCSLAHRHPHTPLLVFVCRVEGMSVDCSFILFRMGLEIP